MRHQHIPEEENNTDVTGRSSFRSEDKRGEEQVTDVTMPIQKAESVENLAGSLSQEVTVHHKALALGAIGLAVFSGLAMVLIDTIGWHWWLTAGMWMYLLVAGGATAGFIYSALKPRKRRRELANTLAKQEDVRSISAWIDLLGLEDGKMRDIAMDALIRLLPRLKASDTALLTEAQRARLYLLLSLPPENLLFRDITLVSLRPDDRETEFRIAILEALKQIGDGTALPIVVRLANGKAKTEGQRRIQEAAQECLPALREFVQEESNRQTLLRAAEMSDAASETLLRAAAGASPTEPDQLLRPSQSGS